jgi:hypothetical protein
LDTPVLPKNERLLRFPRLGFAPASDGFRAGLDAELQIGGAQELFGSRERDAEVTGYFLVGEEFGEEVQGLDLPPGQARSADQFGADGCLRRGGGAVCVSYCLKVWFCVCENPASTGLHEAPRQNLSLNLIIFVRFV